jgi:hypothetical protein
MTTDDDLRSTEYLNIVSEIGELNDLLASIPEGNVIERMSLESRLESARDALAGLPQQIAPKARLTFRGKPYSAASDVFPAPFGPATIQSCSITSPE